MPKYKNGGRGKAVGELLDMTQRLAAKRQAVVTEPDIYTGRDAAILANSKTAELVFLTEQALSSRGAKIKFPNRNIPLLNIFSGTIYAPNTSILNVLSVAKTSAVEIAVAKNYTLPKANQRENAGVNDQDTANALFIVAYGLAAHALKGSARKNIHPIKPNQAVWQHTPEGLPIPEMTALRAASFVVGEHFTIEPFHGYMHTERPDVLLPHIAAVYDPLQRVTARTLYSPLG